MGTPPTATATSVPPTASTSPSVSSASESDSVPPAPATGGGGDAPLPPVIHIFVSAKVSARGVAGADLAFDATAVGIKKEPLQNARFVWSFGDGGSAEGKQALHAYHLPSSYVVMVEASSGEWSATDRREITIAAPQVSLSRLEEGVNGFIEVKNGGSNDLDLSRWFLRCRGVFFSFPSGTILKKGSAVPFPSVITKLAVTASETALLYPNGAEAALYRPELESEPTVEPPTSPEPKPAARVEKTEGIIIPPHAELKDTIPISETPTTTELLASVEAGRRPSTIPFAGVAAVITLLGVCGYVMKK